MQMRQPFLLWCTNGGPSRIVLGGIRHFSITFWNDKSIIGSRQGMLALPSMIGRQSKLRSVSAKHRFPIALAQYLRQTHQRFDTLFVDLF
jgi:hypothetical protein